MPHDPMSLDARLWRAFPVVGLAVSLLRRPRRIEAARAEDAAYREMIESMGETPSLPHAQEQECRAVIIGELAGHLLALAVGGVLLSITSVMVAFFVTVAAAVGLDELGRRAGEAVSDWITARRARS